MYFIDTHAHLDGHEFDEDRDDVIARAKDAGVGRVFIPAIDLPSVDTVLATCSRYPGYAYPMIGLHPEEVKADWSTVLEQMHRRLEQPGHPFIAIGEVGLDYYWSREFEHEQLEAFERQVQWSIEYRLPLMIHCRKGQNEMVNMMRQYKNELPGGVFHCFTGNEKEAAELLQFDNFVLGIGGVLTFKKSHLPAIHGPRANARQAQRERIHAVRTEAPRRMLRRNRAGSGRYHNSQRLPGVRSTVTDGRLASYKKEY